MIGSIIGAGISALGGLGSALIGKKENDDNLKFQKENLDYQKTLQQQVFEREDTAHQREVDDLRKAGLNPLLSTGSGAQAGSVVSTEAPQSHIDYSGVANGFAAAGSAIAAGERYRQDLDMRRELQQEQILQMRAQRQKIAADTISSVLGYDINMSKYQEWLDTSDYRERQRGLDDDLKVLDSLERSGRMSREDAKNSREEAIYKHNLEYAKQHDRPYGASPNGQEAFANMVYRLVTGKDGDAMKGTHNLLKDIYDTATQKYNDAVEVDNVMTKALGVSGDDAAKRSAFLQAMRELGREPTDDERARFNSLLKSSSKDTDGETQAEKLRKSWDNFINRNKNKGGHYR